MEIPEKTVYAGSFFEIEDAGREYIISTFQAAHGEDVPFVGYDKERNAFYFKPNNSETTKLFLGTLGRAIELWTSRRTNDLTDSPRLRPLPNTTLPTESGSLRTEDLRLPNNALIDFEYDSDDSTENSSSAEGGNSMYWEPACGDTSILSQDVAIAIADITECFIFRQADSKRVHLMHGNTAAALEKLRRLEPLLEFVRRHADGPAAELDYSFLSLSSETPGSGVLFAPMTTLPHINRVMVHPAIEEQLENMLISEERQWSNDTGRYTKPENLDPLKFSATATFGASDIWTSFEMPAIGNPVNALPRSSPGTSSVSSGTRSVRPLREKGVKPSQFLPATEQARLAEWSMNIDITADPRIAAEKPVEADLMATATEEPITKRIVLSDSDDETGSPSRTTVQPTEQYVEEPATKRLVAVSDSEDDNEENLPVRFRKGVNQKNQRLPSSREAQTESLTNSSNEILRQIPTSNTNPPTTSSQPLHDTPNPPVKAKTISFQEFYAGVPRDNDVQQDIVQESAQFERDFKSHPSRVSSPLKTKRRGFGYDGPSDGSNGEQPNLDVGTIQKTQTNQYYTQITSADNVSALANTPPFDPTRYGSRDRGPATTGVGPNQPQSVILDTPQDEWTPMKPRNARTTPRNMVMPQDHDNTGVPSSPVAALPKPMPPTHPRGQTTKRRAPNGGFQNRTQVERLIEIDEDDSTKQESSVIRPPPGFEMRTPRGPYPGKDPPSLDVGFEQTQPTTRKCFPDQLASQVEDNMFSSGSSSTGRNSIFDYTPQTQVSRPDINHLRHSTLDSLKSLVQARKEDKMKATSSPVREKIAEDEESTRKYYNTMNLQAPNPGKSRKKSSQSISHKRDGGSEAAARRSRAIEEAYGPVSTNAKADGSKSKDNDPPQLSKQAQKLARKNPALAALHSDTLQTASRKVLLRGLSQKLQSVFDAAAAVFPGTLDFEFQFGQIMVKQNSKIKLKHVYEPHKWSKIFEGSDSSSGVFFSDILTNNGADMDRLLESKASGTKVWDKKFPGRHKVILVFKCQDQTGSEFFLECDENGKHFVTKGVVEIGKIGVHCPGRTWDTCAVLSGTPKWQDIPRELVSAIDEFVDNLHIRPGPLMTVFHRLAAKSTLTVQDVIMRRISLHGGLKEGETDVLLKITETKTLYTQSHLKDKRLFKSFESPNFNQMAKDHQVYYTASIAHARITSGFNENKNLEIGAARSTGTGTCELLTDEYLIPLLGAAIRQVDQIDWMGSHNYGTIQYKFDLRAQWDYEIANTLPPTAAPSRFAKPVHVTAAGLSVAGPRSIAAPPSRTVMTGAQAHEGQGGLPVYGVRMGTYAELWKEADGTLFQFGRGGAKVPLSKSDPRGIVDHDVTPNDSASQVGGNNAGRKAKHAAGGFNAKPDEFW